MSEAILKDGDTPDKTETETIEINGMKYVVTPELAKSLKEQEEKRQKEIEEEKERLQYTPKNYDPPKETPKPEEDQEFKAGDRLFEDPDGTLSAYEKKIKDDMRKEYQAEREKERQEAESQRLLEEFYQDFFKENPELKDNRELVELIFEKKYATWNQQYPGDLKKFKELLANEASGIILKNVKAEPNETPESQTVLEGGGQSVSTPAPKEEEEKPNSLSGVLRQRREARRKQS